MPPSVLGLHHVTATVAHAQEDVDFTLDVLGLRLVKKTVDIDTPHTYHLYYGDELGRPGTLWTTLPRAHEGLQQGIPGAGQVLATAFSVPRAALPFWRARLEAHHVPVAEGRPRFEDEVLVFRHPAGLVMELVGADTDDRDPWTSTIDRSFAIRGLHGVALVVRDPRPTVELLTCLLGGTVVAETDGRVRVGMAAGVAGHFVDVLHDSRASLATDGVGTVHHVAFTVSTRDEQAHLRADLAAAGMAVSDTYDRHYFTAFSVREPGGTRFEVATPDPGVTVDEAPRMLGLELRLPARHEAHRHAIGDALPPLTTS